MKKFIDKFLNRNNLNKYNKIADEVDALFDAKTSKQSIEELKADLAALRDNQNLDKRKKTVQALAIAKSAAQKVLGMTYYRVQLLGGMALIDGNMAEMKTGEGKTLTCSIATITNFALGFKTHVITANEYLSTRDEETLKPLYSALGVASAVNVNNMNQEEKRAAYACDITYSTASELGFDYLRDNLVHSIEEKVQPLDFNKVKIIIDEADFVLIDEATTPLIISGHKPVKDLDVYHKIREITADFQPVSLDPNSSRLEIDAFKPDGDFWLDKKSKRTFLSDQGYDKIEERAHAAGILTDNSPDIYNEANSWLINEICQCLNANWIYEKDKDYVVMDDEIVIVDPNTGRLSVGRSWSNGLHQAIQAKEGITIKPENTTTGTITVQNYLKLYYQISGMSGTIMQSTEEFEQIYSCSTISIPPNRPNKRIDELDRIYLYEQVKYEAMLAEIKKVHATGQPILIGTVSVAESEIVSILLNKIGIKHQVINAKNHELEAKIIAQAGQKNKVTVATSMAGRGTDIILGGNKEAISEAIMQDYSHLSERIEFAKYLIEEAHGGITIDLNDTLFPKNLNLDYTLNNAQINQYYNQDYLHNMADVDPHGLMQSLYQIQYNLSQQLEHIQSKWKEMKEEVLSLGGLCVIGSSRNVSRRIDNQLSGRAGRQGDPGRSVFFMSLEDDWLKVFGNSSLMRRVSQGLNPTDMLDDSMIRRIFTRAQVMAEGQNFEARKNTFQYDSVADQGRKAFFEMRDKFLTQKEEALQGILTHELKEQLAPITNPAFATYLEAINEEDKNIELDKILTKYSIPQLFDMLDSFKEHNEYQMYVESDNEVNAPYFVKAIENFLLTDIETDERKRFAYHYLGHYSISFLDELWCDHLTYIDTAKKSVGYASLVQKNPLHEYRKLCFESFQFLFTNFSAKALDTYMYAYDHKEEIEAAAIKQREEFERQMAEMRQANLSLPKSEETDEFVPRAKREFSEDELIEQPDPIILSKTRFSMDENGQASNFGSDPNPENFNPWNNINKTILNNQRADFANAMGVEIIQDKEEFGLFEEEEEIVDANIPSSISEITETQQEEVPLIHNEAITIVPVKEEIVEEKIVIKEAANSDDNFIKEEIDVDVKDKQ